MKRVNLFCLPLLLICFFPVNSFAYLDAGTGSMILQLVLGGVAGLAVVGKLFWHRILGFFGVRKEEIKEKE